MQKRKLFLFVPFVLTVVISLGIFWGFSGDPNTNAVKGNTFNTITPNYTNTNDNVTAGTWTAGANVLVSRFNGEGATWQRNDTGWLYFIGGDIDGTGNQQTRVDKYNIVTNTWTNVAPCLNALGYMGSARLKDSLYTIGGFNGPGGAFTSTCNILNKYDVNSNTWSVRAPLPEVVGWPAGIGYQDSVIYCIGGMNAGGSNSYATVYVYSSISNSWRTGTPLPAALCGGACSISGDTIVYVGGNSGYFGTPVNTVYKGVISQSNRATITWTTGAVYPGTNRWRFRAANWGCKGIILTAGGPTGFNIGPGETYSYSPGLNAWTALANLPVPTNTAQLGSVKYSNGVAKFVVASGLILSPPYSIPNTQVYTDTLCPVTVSPLCEQFATATFPPTGWTEVFSGTNYWSLAPQSGFNVGTGSAKYDMWDATSGTVQTLFTPLFQASTGTGSFINVDVAFQPFGAPDSLIIASSTDGGTTYTSTARLGNTQLGTTTGNPSPFVPTTAAMWKKLTFTVPQGTNMMLFQGKSGFGDNLYIDSLCMTYVPVGVTHNGNTIPMTYSLSQNYPNPFNPSTQISFGLPKSGIVKLVVFDILGREVKTIVNEFRNAGTYHETFDASSLASGVYFYSISANDFTSTKKMLLVK